LLLDDPDALKADDIAQLCVVDPFFLGSVERMRAARAKAADEADEPDEDTSRDDRPVTMGTLKALVRVIARTTHERYDPILQRAVGRITRAMVRITELEVRAVGVTAPETLASLDQRCGHLETENERLKVLVETLNARPTLEYMGVWAEDTVYSKGHVVTHGGSMWFCHQQNRGTRPGPTPTIWQLCVKSGRDGRDRT
jgi:hypothetical protein